MKPILKHCLILNCLIIFSHAALGQLYTPKGIVGTISGSNFKVGIGTSTPYGNLSIEDTSNICILSLKGKPYKNLIWGPSDYEVLNFTSALRFEHGVIGNKVDQGFTLDSYRSRITIGGSAAVVNFVSETTIGRLSVTEPYVYPGGWMIPTDFRFGVNGTSYFSDFVGINTTCIPKDKLIKLAVKGKIYTEGVRVKYQGANCWADHVFAKNYKLSSLSEVEKYIKENNHLPGIPSAKEVEKEGIQLEEMMKLQMEKIEELTL